MWKRILAGVAAVVVAVGATGFYLSDKIYLRWPHTAVAPADFEHRFPAAALRDDFRFLTATVEHIHPDIGAITGPGYAAEKQRTLKALDRPMTRMAFFRVLAPFAGRSYHDGHTELLTPQEEWDAYKADGGKVPPFAIRIEGGRILVAQAIGAALAQDAELVSLNGVAASALRDWLIDTQSMENRTGQEAYAQRRFASGVWAYGIRPPFTIATRKNGFAATLASRGIDAGEWTRRATVGEGEAFHLEIANGVAHLVVGSFEEPWDRYQGELKGAFQKIHDAHVRAVVLDLRENSGGDTRQSDALQTYLSAKLLPALEQVTVKTTPEVKAAYRTLLPEGFRWIPINRVVPQLSGIQDAPDDGTFAFSPEAAAPVERDSRNDLLFGGPLYLLIGPQTYSTALIAAAPYKYWKRATVIGTPSSEGLTFFGDYYEFDLPNTKLQMHVSHKRFDLYGSKGPGVPLEPDIAVTPSDPDAYAIALREIARRNR
jgi:hypothetical protein